MDVNELSSQALQFVMTYGTKLIIAVVIFIVGKWIIGIFTRLLEKSMAARSVDPTITQFVKNIVYYLLFAFVIIASLGQVGIQTASIVAIMGAAGLAVGLALQGSLANFAAGVLLVLFRPIRVGDYVEAGGASGSVKEISIFSTVLLTPDNKTVVISNANVMGNNIINYSMQDERRVDLVVGISYGSDILLAKRTLDEIVKSEEKILRNKETTIAVSELAGSSVNIVLRPWVKTDDYWTVFFNLNEKIKTMFDEKGIEIPFDQLDINLNQTSNPTV